MLVKLMFFVIDAWNETSFKTVDFNGTDSSIMDSPTVSFVISDFLTISSAMISILLFRLWLTLSSGISELPFQQCSGV